MAAGAVVYGYAAPGVKDDPQGWYVVAYRGRWREGEPIVLKVSERDAYSRLDRLLKDLRNEPLPSVKDDPPTTDARLVDPPPVKRPRGRPRKHPLPENDPRNQSRAR